MAFVRIPGPGLIIPNPRGVGGLTALNSKVIDATGEKFAWIGQAWWNDDDTSKSVERVQFLFGAVTKAGGSALTVSHQNVSTSPPMQPDETQDGTVAIANADASFAANTWYRTGTFSANRTVSKGDLFAVVVEYDGAGRLGADLVNLNNITPTASYPNDRLSGDSLKTGGTWAAAATQTNLLLEFSDGTFGQLGQGGWIASAIGTTGYNSGSSPDEFALRFKFPAPVRVNGVWWAVSGVANNSTDFTFLFEDAAGNDLTPPIAIDLSQAGLALGGFYSKMFPPVELQANTEYFSTLRADTVNNVTISHFTVNSAAHFAVMWGGIEWYIASRTNAGAWTPTTTQRPLCGLYVDAISDGAGGTGSVRYHPGMMGGMRG